MAHQLRRMPRLSALPVAAPAGSAPSSAGALRRSSSTCRLTYRSHHRPAGRPFPPLPAGQGVGPGVAAARHASRRRRIRGGRRVSSAPAAMTPWLPSSVSWRASAGLRAARCLASGARHAAAFVRAAPASVSTLLAVSHLAVALALLRAGIANIRAGLADLRCQFAAACHCAGRYAADRGTIEIQPDAACEVGDVAFLEARVGAMVAGVGAAIAGFDAGRQLFVGHL